MNIQSNVELALRAHFGERADRTVMDGQLEAVLGRTAGTRQRPGWLAVLRSEPMTVITLVRPTQPRGAWLLVAVGLLVAALAAAVLLAGQPISTKPTNGQIVIGRMNDALGGAEVFVVNPDGSGQRAIRPGKTFEGPIWSPDGRQLGLGHAVINADGTGYHEWNQSANPFHIECWDWSPDGQRMLCEGFSDDLASDAQIHGVYTVRASDGTDVVRVSQPGDAGIPGTYSPDGAWVAYTGTFDRTSPGVGGSSGSLIIVRTDGTDRHRLSTLRGLQEPRWAPDGNSILVDTNSQLYSVDVASGRATAILKRLAKPIYSGQWSPDGTRLLIKIWLDGNVELATVLPDGTDLVRVTNNTVDDRFFDWGTHPIEN
jgi:WD40 repeat protein